MSEILIPVANVALSNLNTEGEARLNALESKSNKTTIINKVTPSDVKYPSESAIVNYVAGASFVGFDYNNPISFAFNIPASTSGLMVVCYLRSIYNWSRIYINNNLVGCIVANNFKYGESGGSVATIINNGQIPSYISPNRAPDFYVIYPFL